MDYRIIEGDCIEGMRRLEGQSVNCVVTSPPYFGLRDYGHDGQIGLEASPDAFVAKLVEVFREVRRVLRDDGTVWLNLVGDHTPRYGGSSNRTRLDGARRTKGPEWKEQPMETLKMSNRGMTAKVVPDVTQTWPMRTRCRSRKDLHRHPVARGLRPASGRLVLAQDIIWHKPNPMPESVRDRCTKAHEYIFLLSKSERYYFDSEANASCRSRRFEAPLASRSRIELAGQDQYTQQHVRTAYVGDTQRKGPARNDGRQARHENRNRRSVWTVATKPYKGAHFATFPPDLIRPCILAGCPKDGTVLDPFGGSGTTALVALEEGRKAVLCELNTDYIALAHKRLEGLQLRIA